MNVLKTYKYFIFEVDGKRYFERSVFPTFVLICRAQNAFDDIHFYRMCFQIHRTLLDTVCLLIY